MEAIDDEIEGFVERWRRVWERVVEIWKWFEDKERINGGTSNFKERRKILKVELKDNNINVG